MAGEICIIKMLFSDTMSIIPNSAIWVVLSGQSVPQNNELINLTG